MLLLVAKPLPTLQRFNHLAAVARLVSPRNMSRIEDTPKEGFLWAADNDSFSSWDAARFVKMIDRLEGIPGCLFVACPDVVADHAATVERWEEWLPALQDRGLRPGFVLQDGCDPDFIPEDASAVFIGGSTEWKLGEEAALCAKEAKARGLWLHMGRVNSWRRLQYAAAIGCDSVDGTNVALFTDTHLPRFAEMAAAPIQGMF